MWARSTFSETRLVHIVTTVPQVSNFDAISWSADQNIRGEFVRIARIFKERLGGFRKVRYIRDLQAEFTDQRWS